MKISSVLSQAILSSTSVGVGIALATAIAQPAHAALIGGACNVADVKAGAGSSLINASACKNFGGNDDGFQALINNAFGLTGNTWNLLGKSDQSNDPQLKHLLSFLPTSSKA
mgnify:CR=1 FL=1